MSKIDNKPFISNVFLRNSEEYKLYYTLKLLKEIYLSIYIQKERASRFAKSDGKYYCAILQICGPKKKEYKAETQTRATTVARAIN